MIRLVPGSAHFSSQVRQNLAVDTLSASFFALFAGSIYPFLAALAVQMGAREWEIGILVAAPFVAQLFTVYWGHVCTDKERKLSFVVYPGMLARLVIIPLAFTVNARLFIMLVLLHHLIGAAAFPAFTGLVQKIYPLQFRGRLMGIVRFTYGVFHILSTGLAGFFIDRIGYTQVFLVAAGLGMVGSLIFLRIREPFKAGVTNSRRPFSLRRNLRLLTQNPVLGWFIAGVSLFEIGYLMIQPVLPLYWINRLYLNSVQVGQISIFIMASWFLASPLWGTLIDRTRPHLSIYGAILIYLAVPVIYLNNPTFTGALLAGTLAGAGIAGFEAGWSNFLMRLGGDKATIYVGLYYTLVGIRGLVAPLLGSLLITRGGLSLNLFTAILFITFAFLPLMVADRKIMAVHTLVEAE